jgi:low affinity Fe/Cu permease
MTFSAERQNGRQPAAPGAAALGRATRGMSVAGGPPRRSHPMRELFREFAQQASLTVGSAWAFIVALGVVVVWAASGPAFGFSDTWQLVINTGTTIVTFLMVFLIQNTQNRDAKAIHLKLDELIRAGTHARTELVELERLSDEELERLQDEFHALHASFEQKAKRVSQEVGRRKAKQPDGATAPARRAGGRRRRRPSG